jgi:hypothetical protein
VRVAWVTHHVARYVDETWLLPGGVGGAEMTDGAMMEQAPTDIDIDVHTRERAAT